jgi:glycerol-3-phosphate acyltransferase PlsY
MITAHKILLELIVPAYFLGAVPFGLLVARHKGVDPRKAGSGNIGATNVGRLLGARFFAIVFALDLAKGLVPMLAAATVLALASGPNPSYDAADYALWLTVGFAAIIGHMFSIFIKFKGGKGVATSAGVILGLFPYYTVPGIVGVAAFLLLFRRTRYVSLSSMVGAGTFVIAYLIIGLTLNWPVFGSQWPLLVFAAIIAGLIIYRHRGNLARLRAGTEHRIGT